MTLIIEPAHASYTDNITGYPSVIIINPRSNLTGIAIDYGFNSTGTRAYVRWSKQSLTPYTPWCEITITEELYAQYLNAIDFYS